MSGFAICFVPLGPETLIWGLSPILSGSILSAAEDGKAAQSKYGALHSAAAATKRSLRSPAAYRVAMKPTRLQSSCCSIHVRQTWYHEHWEIMTVSSCKTLCCTYLIQSNVGTVPCREENIQVLAITSLLIARCRLNAVPWLERHSMNTCGERNAHVSLAIED